MPTVGPVTATLVPMVYDSDTAGFAAPADMRGPEVGSVSYTQNSSGNLQLKVKVEFAQVNTKYQIYLVGGPSHDLASGFITIGTLTTNAAGSGSAGLTVSVALLQNSPFGPGFRTDHLDLIGDDPRTSILSIGAINYFICRRVAGAEGAAAAPGAGAGTGDPLSQKGGVKSIKRANVKKRR